MEDNQNMLNQNETRTKQKTVGKENMNGTCLNSNLFFYWINIGYSNIPYMILGHLKNMMYNFLF